MIAPPLTMCGNQDMRMKLCLAALAATTAFAVPAMAQTAVTATAQARGLVVQPLTLTRIQHLDFGTVLSSATTPGWVAVDADTGLRTADGVGLTLVATGPGGRGLFTGAGTAAVQVQLSLGQPVGGVVVSGTNQIAANLVLDQGGLTTRTIPAAGTFNVGVGGTFNTVANQPAGLYAADFTLTAQYP